MKIAQIAPLIESVPPRFYGGTERVVSYLTEELVAEGHDVTLFASAESITSARLVACSDQALRQKGVSDPMPHYASMFDKVRIMAREFDILHFHVECIHFPLFCDLARCTVSTVHGRQDLPGLAPAYATCPRMPLVSISDAQRRPAPEGNFVGTVLHGLPVDLFTPTFEPRGGYLAFLGRTSPEKGVEDAIAIARAVCLPLKIAAKVDLPDIAYFREAVEPLLGAPGVEFIGEINDRQKTRFLGDALALLFPIDWPEPFGLVMIESMACGAPVLAYRRGSVPEVIEEGVTGCIVDSFDEAVQKIDHVLTLDRGRIRRRFEERFSAHRMAADYVDIYQGLLGASRSAPFAKRRLANRVDGARESNEFYRAPR